MSDTGGSNLANLLMKSNEKASLFEDHPGSGDFNQDMLDMLSKKFPEDSSKGPMTVADKRLSKVPSRYSVKERLKVVSDTEDPLSEKTLSSYEPVLTVTKENLTIRKDDEARIVAALHSASKKQTTGSIYSVVVDLGKTGTLGIGVKDLTDHVLAVSMLKRENCTPGAGEDAGIRLGDIIFGVNFVPTREGTKTLIGIIKKESARGKTHVHIQGWRCHQLCSDPIPGYLFPRADDVLVQAYSLVQSKVFSDWERWNFIEILLGHMLEDLKMRANEESTAGEDAAVSPHVLMRAKQMQVLDLERNILQAKGLRTALCVRIVHTKTHGDTVVYVLRVEDVESGLQWVVQRRYSDFFALNEELLDMTHFTKEVEFPRKRLSIRNTAKLVEMRIVALEQYMRRMLHILTLYATMDSSASRTLRHLQTFLGVDNYLDCVHPPALDDQRFIELMAYRFLNDFGSEACQQCVRFITTVDLDGTVETGPEGYMPVLNFVRDALSEVEQFVQEQHMSQMIQTLRSRRADLNQEQLRSFVRKCIRRQVEAALYLPLRRTVFRIVFNFLAAKSKTLQRSITLLQRATPKFLMVDAFVTRAVALPRTVKAFRRVIQAYLPADQGQLLIQAATAVMELHKECQAEKNRVAALSAQGKMEENNAQEAESATVVVPRKLSEEIDFNFISTKTPDLDIGVVATVSDDRRGGDSDLPDPVRRPVVNKLRDLFTRKKTSDDLFASDSDPEDAPAVPSTTLPPAAPTAEPTTPPRHASSTSSAPNSPQRTAKFIQRLLPRSNGSSKNLDTADNLFVDEQKAFTVSVKSESSSVQDHRSGATSQCSTPPPIQRVPSTNDTTADDDLGVIEKLTSDLMAASLDGISRCTKGPEHLGDIAVPSRGIADSVDRADEPGHQVPVSKSASAPSPLSPSADHTKHDASVLASLHLPDTPAAVNKVRGWDDDDSIYAPIRTPSTSTAGPGSHFAMSGHSKGMLEALVGRQSAIMQQRIAHLTQAQTESQSGAGTETKAGAQGHAHSSEASDAGLSGSIPNSLSAEEDGAGDAPVGTKGEPERHRAEPEEDTHNTRDSLLLNSNVEVEPVQYDAISADDFLPLFTYVLIQAGLPQLLLVKELMTALVNDEDSYGECGYYLATMEAATQHIFDLAEQYERTVLGAPRGTLGGAGVGTGTGAGTNVGVGVGGVRLDDNGEEVIEAFDDKVTLAFV